MIRTVVETVAAVLAILVATAACRRDARAAVTVSPKPADAVVWQDGRPLGPGPQIITMPEPDREIVLRVSRDGYEDWTGALVPEAVSAAGELVVELTPRKRVNLLCSSSPDGADVFVDGEFHGRTPLRFSGLAGDRHELDFRCKERRAVSRTVLLTEPEQALSVTLPSLLEEFYLAEIRKAPGTLTNYADLVHHYMMAGRLDDAMAVFRKSIPLALVRPGPISKRLWRELEYIATRQYEFGSGQQVAAAQEQVQALMTGLYGKHEQPLTGWFYSTYAIVLRESGDRAEARRIAAEGRRKFRGHAGLQQLRIP